MKEETEQEEVRTHQRSQTNVDLEESLTVTRWGRLGRVEEEMVILGEVISSLLGDFAIGEDEGHISSNTIIEHRV